MTTLCLCDLAGFDDELRLEAKLRAEYAALKGDSFVERVSSETEPALRRTEAPAWMR
jgi:hypothetical protein